MYFHITKCTFNMINKVVLSYLQLLVPNVTDVTDFCTKSVGMWSSLWEQKKKELRLPVMRK